MIITRHFIFIHFGKTGGDKFFQLMNKYYAYDILTQHYVKGDDHTNTNPEKHMQMENIRKIYAQQFNLKYLDHVVGFRKLTNWICSHNSHQLTNKYKDIDNKKLDFVNEQSNQGKIIRSNSSTNIYDSDNWLYADNALYPALQGTICPIFIRQEKLLADFISKIAYRYYDSQNIEDNTIINSAYSEYQVTIDTDNLATIHKNNPFWSEMEERIYSDE